MIVAAFFRTFFLQIFDFSSRTTRRWYYIYGFLNTIVSMVCFFYLVGEFMDYGAAFFVVMGKIDYFFLATFFISALSSIAITVRRLHDSGKSGWFILFLPIPLLQLVLLFFLLLPGENDDNQYGENPRDFDYLR